ncbi:two-component sensor histidine kinase [Amorphus suaedae]
MKRVFRRMPTATIGFYLIAMVVAVALPMLAFVVILLDQLEGSERVALERRTVRDSQALSAAVDRQLHDMSVTLRLLATAQELAGGDLETFHNRTQSVLRSSSMFLILADSDGQQRLNTRVPYGTELGRMSDIDSLKSALNSNTIEVSDVFFGRTGGHWVFNVTMPLPEELAERGAALILTQNVETLSRLIKPEGLPPGWSATLIDGAGRIILSSDGTASGETYDPRLVSQITGYSGIIGSEATDTGMMAGYARVPGWSWSVVIAGPVNTAQASLVSTWRLLILGGLILVMIAIGAAFFLGRQMRNSIVSIADMAEQLGKGEIVSPISTRITEADMVSIALSEASFDRAEAEDRIHFVMRELAHRTKNLLSVIQAMLRQTARQSDTLQEFQVAVSGRLQGLARSIDLLTAENWTRVSIPQLVNSHLENFIDTEDRLEARGDNFPLRPEAVQNVGMALHELATNAVKYGAWSVPHGKVLVEWSEAPSPTTGDPWLTIRWRESGGPPVVAPSRKGFGTTVIERQLMAAFAATVTLDYLPDGLEWTMTAPCATLKWEARKTDQPG